MLINVFCIGDIVGRAGRMILAEKLPELVADRNVDMVVGNAENAAGGSGLTPRIFKKLLGYGVDAVTLGDHAYRKREICQALETSDRIVRPANLSPQAVGKRWTVVPTKSGLHRVGVTCVLGQLYMGACDSPWAAVDRALKEMDSEVKVRIVECHAEATSEKIAMGWYLNGRASIVFGTHTHVATADARVLDGGTAYITDLGMTGPHEGVLGRRKDRVLSALTTAMPAPFEVSVGDPRVCGALIGVETDDGRAASIERIEIRGQAAEGGPYDADDRGRRWPHSK